MWSTAARARAATTAVRARTAATAVLTVSLAMAAVPMRAVPIAAQRAAAAPAATDRASLLALVRAGKAADAWKAWAALPVGAAKHRLGVEIAVEAKDIARALDEYDSLTVNGKTPDQALLKLTALGEATILAADRDPDVRLEACAAAVVLDAAHAACRPLLEDMAAHGADPDHQGLGAYALANAGQRPFPGLFGTLELTMTRATRLRLAQSMTRLPAAERLALAREFIEDREPAVQYQTMLVLADVPGEDVAAALRSAQVSGPATLARTVALGRHGDAASLASLDEMLPNLTGYVKIEAARALTDALRGAGEAALENMLHSPVDLERVQAAEHLGRINPDAAFRSLLESLNGGSPAIRSSALFAAGTIRMGTDRSVYRRLAGEPPDVSAMAVRAIADTLVPVPVPPRTPPHP